MYTYLTENTTVDNVQWLVLEGHSFLQAAVWALSAGRAAPPLHPHRQRAARLLGRTGLVHSHHSHPTPSQGTSS